MRVSPHEGGATVLSPTPGQNPWTATVDLPAKNLRVTVTGNLDLQTHHLTWYFSSENLSNGGTPPLSIGVLPPNNAQHDGEASVQFTVQPKEGIGSAAINNAASITFNDPPAINTQSHF